ncbi:MAG: mechanosensitive ion channel domain-containing protein [Gemmatimonadota bacterium]
MPPNSSQKPRPSTISHKVIGAREEATRQLSRFRRGSRTAIAFAALLLLIWAPSAPATQGSGSPPATDSLSQGPILADSGHAETSGVVRDARTSVKQATGTIRGLWRGFQALLPKVAIALLVLLMAGGINRLMRPLLRRAFRSFHRADAFGVLAAIVLWLLAFGVALSVLAGDVRTLIGSLGLIGLALSWALQGPIESFTGWFINSFKGHYRVGDRIAVGEVFGDVYRIDLLTTTVWEAGGPGKAVQAAQPTGALVTFPNSEVLRSNIVNYTGDFAYVWDEVSFGVTNESDLPYVVGIVRQVAMDVVGKTMAGPAEQYRKMLLDTGLAWDVAVEPQVYLSLSDAWTNATVRYLVAARERRMWSSRLIEAMAVELAKPDHKGRIIGSYPRTDVKLIDRE